MNFLVIDDSAVDRQFLTSLLENLGHQVDAYGSTAGVIEKIKSGKYSSVFLDIVMPEKDGYKFLRELRSNQQTAQQHVIFYSNKKMLVEMNYGLKRVGANDYLAKPITRERLERALARI
jgi:twitching motility two-component system response regulator PilH